MIQRFGSVADCDFGLFFKSSGPLTTEGNKTDAPNDKPSAGVLILTSEVVGKSAEQSNLGLRFGVVASQHREFRHHVKTLSFSSACRKFRRHATVSTDTNLKSPVTYTWSQQTLMTTLSRRVGPRRFRSTQSDPSIRHHGKISAAHCLIN